MGDYELVLHYEALKNSGEEMEFDTASSYFNSITGNFDMIYFVEDVLPKIFTTDEQIQFYIQEIGSNGFSLLLEVLDKADTKVSDAILEALAKRDLLYPYVKEIGLSFLDDILTSSNPDVYIPKEQIQSDLILTYISYVFMIFAGRYKNKTQLDIFLEKLSELNDKGVVSRENYESIFTKTPSAKMITNPVVVNFSKGLLDIAGLDLVEQLTNDNIYGEKILEFVQMASPEMYRILLRKKNSGEGEEYDSLENVNENDIETITNILVKDYPSLQGEIPIRILEKLEETELYEWMDILVAHPEFIEELESITMRELDYVRDYDTILNKMKDYPIYTEALNNLKSAGLMRESIITEIVRKTIKEILNEQFTTYHGKEYNSFREWAYDYAKTNTEGFNSYEDAVEYLDWFIDVIDKLPTNVTLYRILQVDKRSDINKKNLGKHFTDNKDNFDDGFLQSLGFSRSEIQEKKFYIVTILINKNQIDFANTVATRLTHPYEDEYTLKDNAAYKIIEVEQFIS